MTSRFGGKTVVVTGASRGIGEAIARAFHAEGAYVIGTSTGVADANGDYCDEWVTADFLALSAIDDCAARVAAIAPDILVNNAGINRIAPFVEIVSKDFVEIHQVNVLAPMRLCQAALPAMIRRQWGRIVNVSSVWGKISKRQRASYSASKFALDGLTLALATEHSQDGVLANCVAPGFIDTELTRRVLGAAGIEEMVAGVPVRRLGQAEEVARVVLWLASAENSFIAGQNVSVDGGFSRV